MAFDQMGHMLRDSTFTFQTIVLFILQERGGGVRFQISHVVKSIFLASL